MDTNELTTAAEAAKTLRDNTVSGNASSVSAEISPKTAYSKNITIEEWNQIVADVVALLSNSAKDRDFTDAVYAALKTFSDYYFAHEYYVVGTDLEMKGKKIYLDNGKFTYIDEYGFHFNDADGGHLSLKVYEDQVGLMSDCPFYSSRLMTKELYFVDDYVPEFTWFEDNAEKHAFLGGSNRNIPTLAELKSSGKSLGHSLQGNASQWTFQITLKNWNGEAIDTESQVFGSATQSTAGLMSASDKAHLDALYSLLGTDDDTVVNTINEVLAIFDQYPEGADLVSALAAKLSKTEAAATYLARTDALAIGMLEVTDYDPDTGEIGFYHLSDYQLDYDSDTGELTISVQ